MNFNYILVLSLIFVGFKSFAGGTVGSADNEAEIFVCQGFEPTWFAEVDTQKQILKIGDHTMKVHSTMEATVTQAMSTSGNYAFRVAASATSLTVMENLTCTDDFTNIKYTHAAMLVGKTGIPLRGCCNRKK